MLNLKLGSSEIIDGRSCIVTRKGHFGHAVYGPYEHLVPGEYLAGFNIAPADAAATRGDVLLAAIDISSDLGRNRLARHEVRRADLADGMTAFTIPFTVTTPCRAEYRVWTSGKAALIVEDNHPAAAAIPGEAGADVTFDDAHFPDAAGAEVPFFVAHRDQLRALFDRGIVIRVADGAVRLVVGGIVLDAACADDLAFIGELFFENAYNFMTARPTCVVDIGMNIGLASLHFASKAEVREVHSFEPFPETYYRAIANLRLNPALHAKITAHNLGLSDADYSGPVAVADHGHSGAMSTVGIPGGVNVHLALRDAGPLLAPIIDDAVARGLDVILKVDCEGSEFPVFDSIARAGLLPKIRAFMVEWHAMFDDKTQHTLIAPLKEAGFVVFDRSPPMSNGFFYAVRTG